MAVLDMLLITIIVVVVIDLTDFIDSLKSGLKWIITKGKMSSSDYRIKPIDCSLCMTFWCNIIFLLVTSNFSLPFICIALLMSFFTGVIKDSLLLVKDLFSFLINKISEKL